MICLNPFGCIRQLSDHLVKSVISLYGNKIGILTIYKKKNSNSPRISFLNIKDYDLTITPQYPDKDKSKSIL